MTNKSRQLKKLKAGDAVEVVWKDATTIAQWTSPAKAAGMELATILTRGTLVAIRDDAIVVALDSALDNEGRSVENHGIGVVELGSVKEVHKLRR